MKNYKLLTYGGVLVTSDINKKSEIWMIALLKFQHWNRWNKQETTRLVMGTSQKMVANILGNIFVGQEAPAKNKH
jgi:hypothetical protein